ncbi:MAG: porin [Pelistega sp.]|nr:porin [Pelistega sp.]
MKKSVLFLALTGALASTVQADTTVTLYGVVDGGIGVTDQSIRVDGESVWAKRTIGVRSGVQAGNRWGLRGQEDLGNGTSAIFQLESGFDLNDGTSLQGGRLFGRRAVVGLTSDSWGTVTIGRQYPVADDFIAKLDPFGISYSQASFTRTFADSVGVRRDNVIKYLSPSFSGFSFGVSLIADDTQNYTSTTNDVKTRNTAVGVGFGYKNDPIMLGAAYDYERNKQTVNGMTNPRYNKSMSSWVFGGTYDFEVVKLHLIYGQQHNGVISGNFGPVTNILFKETPNFAGYNFNTRGVRMQSWLAGLSKRLEGGSRVMFSYQGSRIKHADLAVPTGKADIGTVRVNSHIWSVAYVHALSKRTSIYTVGSYGEFKAKFGTAGAQRAKLKSTEVVLGLNHRF